MMRSLVQTFLILVVALLPLGVFAGGRQEASAVDETGGRADAEEPAGAEPASSELRERFDNQQPPRGAASQFRTSFSRAIVSFEDIVSGGPPKDGIPAIDNPRFESVEEARQWLKPTEAVFVVSATGETHIHPVQILMWHEIVNDEVGGVPITVTYCPLCNTGVAFQREFDGQVLDFGVSGRLRFSNMIMYDRQTETWWQQASGRAIVGEHVGRRLELYPTLLLPWEEAAAGYPEAQVLSRETGFNRSYGTNPYRGYDRSDRPFLYSGPAIDDSFNPMTRVLSLEHGGETEAVPYPVLREEGVVSLSLGGTEVVVFWLPGTASALDSDDVAGGRDVGTANAFLSSIDGEVVEFRRRGADIIDVDTGSLWNSSGAAVSGPRRGSRLEPIVTVQHFWFSWTAFDPG